jgi:hypothetical protein
VVLSKFICVYGWAIAIVLLVSGVIEFHLYIVGLWLSNWILVLMLKGNCLIDWTHVNNRQTEGHIIRCYFESETDRGTHYSVLFWEWDRQRDTLFGAILRVRQTVIPGYTENASYWFGKVFSAFRYWLGWIWLAETKGGAGHLVLIELDLASVGGFFE